MKKVILLVFTIVFISNSFGQSKMAYSSKKREKYKNIILKSEHKKSLRKISKKKQSIFVNSMATFYALSNKNQHKLVNNTLKSLTKDKYISKKQYAILYKLLNSKTIKKEYLHKLKKQKVKKYNLGNVLIKVVAKDYLETYSGSGSDIPVQGYGWKKVAGSVIGAGVGMGIGFLAGAAPPAIIAGGVLGAKIGGDIGEAVEENDAKKQAEEDSGSNSSSSSNDNDDNNDEDDNEPINTNDGNGCTAYPFTPMPPN